MPGTLKLEKGTTVNGSDLRQLMIQYNNLAKDVAAMQQGLLTDNLWGWYGVGANSTATRFAVGSTPARLGTAAMVLSIAGVPVIKAIDSVGTVFGSLGTIPTGTWGLIAVDVVAAGTVTYASAAASYTTGYTTEALAIAAMPPRLTVKARIGYITLLAASPGFVVGTDTLVVGGSLTTLNLYPADGVMAPQGLALNGNGVVSLALVNNTFNPAWIGGKNGVLQGTTLGIGSNDYAVASTAFTYNANGLTNIPKAAVTAGTVFVAGTIPADQWGIYAAVISAVGTITYVVGPANYTTGYATQTTALADLGNMFPAAGLALLGYFTVKTGAGLAWVAGTDALAGGTTGNEASVTNYFNVPSVTLASGESASLIANRAGVVWGPANY